MEPARPPNYRFRGIVSAPAFRERFLAAALLAPVKRRNRQSVAPAHLPHSRDIPEVFASLGKITPKFYSGGPHEP
jgi:hypothetical protein